MLTPVFEKVKSSVVMVECIARKFLDTFNIDYYVDVSVAGAPTPWGRLMERNWIDVMKDTFQPLLGTGKATVKKGCPALFCRGVLQGSVPSWDPSAKGWTSDTIVKRLSGNKFKVVPDECGQSQCGESRGKQSVAMNTQAVPKKFVASNFLRSWRAGADPSRPGKIPVGAGTNQWNPVSTSAHGMRPLPYTADPNFVVMNGTCKGNNEDFMYGPLNLTFARYAVATNTKMFLEKSSHFKQESDGGGIMKMERVCDFTFTLDNHICRPAACEGDRTKRTLRGIQAEELKWQTCADGSKSKQDCCDPANVAVARMTSSSQDTITPGRQKPGHNCRAWYLSTLPYVQSLVSGLIAQYTGQLQMRCHRDKAIGKCDPPARGPG